MKKFLLLILFISTNLTFAQTVFTVEGFSNKYYGKVLIDDTSQIFSKGSVAIIDKQSNKELLKVDADELALELHNGRVLANINELPYGEQSLIIYDDFNFDSINDFAIEEGQNSCYHTPSFNIYLATGNKFIYNENFSRLAQDYCGMFQINQKEKRINTMSKSGCCWHQFSEFIVANNQPKAIKIIEDGESEIPYSMHTEQIWNGKRMVKTSTKKIDLEQKGIKVVLSFTMEKSNKQAVLFSINERTLNYAVIRKNGSIEFEYPQQTNYQNTDFKLDITKPIHTLTFKNKSATYTICESKNNFSIKINVAGKNYNWVSQPTAKGSLDSLVKLKLENVIK